MSKAESSDYNLKLNIYTCIYNKLVHVQSTPCVHTNTISTTLLSNTQSTYWVPKLKTRSIWMCTGSVQRYLFQTFMLSHLTGLLINIGLPCTCKLKTFHIQFFHFLCYSQGTRATDQRTRVTDTTPTLHQYTRAIFTWFGGGGETIGGYFFLKTELSCQGCVLRWHCLLCL